MMSELDLFNVCSKPYRYFSATFFVVLVILQVIHFMMNAEKYSFVDILLVLCSVFNPAAWKNWSTELWARLRCALRYLESRNNAGEWYMCLTEVSVLLHSVLLVAGEWYMCLTEVSVLLHSVLLVVLMVITTDLTYQNRRLHVPVTRSLYRRYNFRRILWT